MTAPPQLDVPLRLTRKEAHLIFNGLGQIRGAHLAAVEGLLRSEVDPWAVPHELGFDSREYNEHCVVELENAYQKILSVTSATKRLWMNVFEVAACMLGLRETAKRIQRKYYNPNRRNYRAAIKHLLGKLENIRRRARRVVIQEFGKDRYQGGQHPWARFVRWIQLNYLWVHPKSWKSLGPGQKTRYKKIVASWVSDTLEEFQELQVPPPPQDQIVAVVKKALRSAKRLRRQIGRRSVGENQIILSEHIRDFINRKCISPAKRADKQARIDRVLAAAGILQEESSDDERERARKCQMKKPSRRATKKCRARKPRRESREKPGAAGTRRLPKSSLATKIERLMKGPYVDQKRLREALAGRFSHADLMEEARTTGAAKIMKERLEKTLYPDHPLSSWRKNQEEG